MDTEKFDFETIIERRGMDALAVDGAGKIKGFAPEKPQDGFSFIPMWIADMNFATAPSITKAMKERLEHPLFGYFAPSTRYYNSIIDWHERRKNVHGLLPEHIGYENGVLGGLVSALNVLASRGDHILVHSPVYIGFTKTLENNGYRMVRSPLVKDEKGIWRMDYEDMDRKIKENHIHTAIFCSPHNPTGRVWEREEIEKAMEVYRRNQVFVISDEIWSDLIMAGNHHIPTQSVSEDAKMRTVALYAPSKTFNLAGLVGSYHIVYNSWLRERMEKQASLCHYNEMNVLSMHALTGAYSEEGEMWLEQLLTVIEGNHEYVVNHLNEKYPEIDVSKPEGTYMLFLDLQEWCNKYHTTIDQIQEKAWNVGVGFQDGRIFGGNCTIRMNLALPRKLLMEAMDRLDSYVLKGDIR